MHAPEPVAMPIRERQPETIDLSPIQAADVTRPGDAEDGISARDPGALLSRIARTQQAPSPIPARALALDALRLARQLRDPSRLPARWARPGFGTEVELIRRQLAPVRTRRMLAASYGREAFHLAPALPEQSDPSPTRLAYALRWLELRDGATGPSWQTLLS